MRASEIPEAAGPGSYAPDGTVLYGDQAAPGARVFVPPRMPASERDRIRAEAERGAGCHRCAGIPADLLASLRTALTGKQVPR
jgi:hypothetical protein